MSKRGVRWTEEELRDYQRRNGRIETPALQNRSPLPSSNVERTPRRKSVEPKIHSELDTQGRVELRIINRRHRLADSDGISGKAVIDGIVLAGLLQDDRAEVIAEVRPNIQVKIPMNEPEQTIVEIWEA